MPSILSKNPNLKLRSLGAIFFSSSLTSALLIFHFYRKSKRANKLLQQKNKLVLTNSNGVGSKKKIDHEFIQQLKQILAILIPKWNCSEIGYLGLISTMLVVRSLCDVWIIYLGTLLESAIITQNKSKFGHHLLQFGMTMPLMSLINSVLKFSTEKLQLRFRSRLTTHLLQSYMNHLTFYKIQCSNIDQLLSADVDRFTQSLTSIYSQLAKPVLDIVIYIYGISSNIGVQVPIYMMGYLAIAAGLLIRLRKPMSHLTAEEQNLEGEFRFCNSRLGINAEEVAFYGGRAWELNRLLTSFNQLIQHCSSFIEFKFVMNFAENIVAKYIATVVGYYSVSRPFLTTTKLNSLTHQEKLETYYKSGRMLVNLSQAIGRLVINIKEVSKLAGFTGRIHQLMTNLNTLNNCGNSNSCNNNQEVISNINTTEGKSKNPININETLENDDSLGIYRIEDNIIKFHKVPIVTPNGDVLLKELNLEVKSGTNILVCGPNGCGKSSLFRILGELWPLKVGILTKPTTDKLFYVPQRPYMPMGTLRDQIIYPNSVEDMTLKGMTDTDLESILKIVDLDWLVNTSNNNSTSTSSSASPSTSIKKMDSKPKMDKATTTNSKKSNEIIDEDEKLVGQRRNWNDFDNWMDCLSGGQKQRLAMARLIYHKPQFAILDECTSAISVDVEGNIYNYCKNVGITLFTVSHRKSLWTFHEYYLYMDGKGQYTFSPITDETIEFGT